MLIRFGRAPRPADPGRSAAGWLPIPLACSIGSASQASVLVQPVLDQVPGDRVRVRQLDRPPLGIDQLRPRCTSRHRPARRDRSRSSSLRARGAKAQHQRGRERPGLRASGSASSTTSTPGLLVDLAAHRLLERFAGLDEARERRVEAGAESAPSGRAGSARRARGWRWVTSTITAGSLRGKCCASQIWQRRMWPPCSLTVGAAAHAAVAVARLCQKASAAGVGAPAGLARRTARRRPLRTSTKRPPRAAARPRSAANRQAPSSSPRNSASSGSGRPSSADRQQLARSG